MDDYLKSLPSHRSKRQASEKLCIEKPGKRYTFIAFCITTYFYSLCAGTRINVFWPNIGKQGSWFMATVKNLTEKGTFCVYDDGARHYHDLYEEKYVVLTQTEEPKSGHKKQKAYTFDTEALEREMKCAICLDYMREPMTLNECSHSYCKTCLVTHLAGSKNCPLCPWVHVNSKRDAWYNQPLKKLIDIYNRKDETKSDVTTSSNFDYLKKESDVTVVKTQKRRFRCSMCTGWKSAPAQKCSFPCTGGDM